MKDNAVKMSIPHKAIHRLNAALWLYWKCVLQNRQIKPNMESEGSNLNKEMESWEDSHFPIPKLTKKLQ